MPRMEGSFPTLLGGGAAPFYEGGMIFFREMVRSGPIPPPITRAYPAPSPACPRISLRMRSFSRSGKWCRCYGSRSTRTASRNATNRMNFMLFYSPLICVHVAVKPRATSNGHVQLFTIIVTHFSCLHAKKIGHDFQIVSVLFAFLYFAGVVP